MRGELLRLRLLLHRLRGELLHRLLLHRLLCRLRGELLRLRLLLHRLRGELLRLLLYWLARGLSLLAAHELDLVNDDLDLAAVGSVLSLPARLVELAFDRYLHALLQVRGNARCAVPKDRAVDEVWVILPFPRLLVLAAIVHRYADCEDACAALRLSKLRIAGDVARDGCLVDCHWLCLLLESLFVSLLLLCSSLLCCRRGNLIGVDSHLRAVVKTSEVGGEGFAQGMDNRAFPDHRCWL